jgi:hypothetical protein
MGKKKNGKGWGTLGFLPATKAKGEELSRSQLIISLATAIGANVAGAIVFGKYSGYASAPLIGLGIWKKNLYLASAGAGMLVASGYQTPPVTPATDTPTSFDLTKIGEGMKERAGNYFKNFGEKLHLPKKADPPADGTNGLNGEDEKVSYYISPSEFGKLDLSELDRIQQQVEAMNGMGELEVMEMNL